MSQIAAVHEQTFPDPVTEVLQTIQESVRSVKTTGLLRSRISLCNRLHQLRILRIGARYEYASRLSSCHGSQQGSPDS
jgi:hypothetical protein